MKLTKREQTLADRAGDGTATEETTAWVAARRETPGLTLRQFQRQNGTLAGPGDPETDDGPTRDELREQAKALGLSAGGSKADLAKRIADHQNA